MARVKQRSAPERSAEEVQALFEKHQALAQHLVNKFSRVAGYEKEDMLQHALLALWRAAKEYHQEVAQFSTFAHRVISNEIMGHMKAPGSRSLRVGQAMASMRGECQPYGDGVEESFKDPARLVAAPEEGDEAEEKEELLALLELLPDRQRQAVEMYYGVNGTARRSLRELGRALGVVGERGRQLVSEGVKNLRRIAVARGHSVPEMRRGRVVAAPNAADCEGEEGG